MSEPRSQQQLLDYFAGYVSPQKVNMYRMWGVDFIPGRREGVRVWDHDGRRTWIDCRSAGAAAPRADLARTEIPPLAAPGPPGPLSAFLNLARRLILRAWRSGYRQTAG